MSRQWVLYTACLLSAAVTGCQTAGTSMTANSPLGDLLKKKDASTHAKDSSVSEEYKAASSALSDPENVLLAYAMWKEESEQFDEARAKYQDIVNANPSNLSATLGLARTEYRSGRRTQAMEVLENASVNFPNNADVCRELAAFHAHSSDWDAAINAYQRAAELNPNHADGRYRLGTALARAGRIDEALPHLTYSVGDAAAYYNLGYILFQQNRSHEARQFFERALRESPSSETQSRASEMLAQLSTPRTQPIDANYGVMARTASQATSIGGNDVPTYQNAAPQMPRAPVVAAPNYPAAGNNYAAAAAPDAQPWQRSAGVRAPVTPAAYSMPTITAAGTPPTARRSSAAVPPLPSSFDRAVSSAIGFSSLNAPQANYPSQQQQQQQRPANGTEGVIMPSNWQR